MPERPHASAYPIRCRSENPADANCHCLGCLHAATCGAGFIRPDRTAQQSLRLRKPCGGKAPLAAGCAGRTPAAATAGCAEEMSEQSGIPVRRTRSSSRAASASGLATKVRLSRCRGRQPIRSPLLQVRFRRVRRPAVRPTERIKRVSTRNAILMVEHNLSVARSCPTSSQQMAATRGAERDLVVGLGAVTMYLPYQILRRKKTSRQPRKMGRWRRRAIQK
ncbi:hypothetical protein V1281_004728 [Nitrobacteraceae bacterium AZCC 2161]